MPRIHKAFHHCREQQWLVQDRVRDVPTSQLHQYRMVQLFTTCRLNFLCFSDRNGKHHFVRTGAVVLQVGRDHIV